MPVDFGSYDVSTFVDGGLDPTFAPLSQERALMECVARGWLSPPGSVPWALEDGEDIRQLLSAKMTGTKLLAWTVRLENAALQDERVLACTVVITPNAAAKSLSIGGVIETASGPFNFVLNVSAVTAALLSPS